MLFLTLPLSGPEVAGGQRAMASTIATATVECGVGRSTGGLLHLRAAKVQPRACAEVPSWLPRNPRSCLRSGQGKRAPKHRSEGGGERVFPQSRSSSPGVPPGRASAGVGSGADEELPRDSLLRPQADEIRAGPDSRSMIVAKVPGDAMVPLRIPYLRPFADAPSGHVEDRQLQQRGSGQLDHEPDLAMRRIGSHA